jgi:hypothetical protein
VIPLCDTNLEDLDPVEADAEPKVNAVSFHGFFDQLGRVGIFLGEELAVVLKHDHLATKSTERLRQLHTDRPSLRYGHAGANNQTMRHSNVKSHLAQASEPCNVAARKGNFQVRFGLLTPSRKISELRL